MKKKMSANRFWALIFFSPWVIYMIVFLMYPFLIAISNSFKSFDAIDKYHVHFTGLENWIRAVSDKLFWLSLGNVVYNQVIFIVVSFLVAFTSALLLSGTKRIDNFFRTIYFLPVMTSITVAMLVFSNIIGPEGPIVSVLLKLGLLDKPFLWTYSRWLPMPILALFSSWRWFGTQMVIFIGGIASIDQSIFEAADIDGAGKLDKVFRMILPMLKPQIVFVITMNIINGLQMFTEVYMPFGTSGGIYKAGLTPVLYLYHMAFNDPARDIGYASTLGILLAIVIFVATSLQLKVTDRGDDNA